MDIILGCITGLSIVISISLWVKLKQANNLIKITREDRNMMLKKYMDCAGIPYKMSNISEKITYRDIDKEQTKAFGNNGNEK